MAEVKRHEPGTFSWIELSTTDQPGATRFYSELFGWKVSEVPLGPPGSGGVYSMLRKDDADVAALFSMRDEDRQQKVPPHWATYVAVQSADETSEKARSLGATVIAPPFEVMDVGHMSVLQDPTGAFVSLWEGKTHQGVGRVGEPGALCWNELLTRDLDKAVAFYTGLFGWTVGRMEKGGDAPPYTVLKLGEQEIAGVLETPPDWGQMPSYWAVYFGVTNIDESTRRARGLGARLLYGPAVIPDVGRFAILEDPQGAVFDVIEQKVWR